MTQPEKWTAFGDNTVEPTQPALVEARQEARHEVRHEVRQTTEQPSPTSGCKTSISNRRAA